MISKVTFLKIYTKKNFIKIKYKNILVGELMYDFYLRYFKKHQLKFNDHYEIKKIANYVEFFYKNLNKMFTDIKKENIYQFVPWQACYIQCGIPVRFFLKKDVKTIGRSQEIFSKKYTKKDYLQSYYFENLRREFRNVKNKKKKIKESFQLLKSRFNGNINPEINYLNFSAFKKENYKKIESKIDVIIFLPDFVDSPHSFGGEFFFPDFYDWIIETINVFKNNGSLNVAIKPHPNSRYISTVFVELLKKQYKQFNWLEKTISNHAIFEKKPKIGISPRGSVLFDLAYHGITPIALGRNPCMAYPFVYTSKTTKQYFNFIKNGLKSNLKMPINYKNLVAECYYMNFLNKPEFYETKSSKVKLKNYRTASVEGNIEMLKKFNNGFFK